MDNNDFRPTGNETGGYNNSGAPEQQAYKGDNPGGQGWQPGGFSGGYYGNVSGGGPQGPNKKSKKRSKGAIVAVLMALSLIAGCAVGVFVIGNDFIANNGRDVALATPSQQALQPGNNGIHNNSPAEDRPLTTDNPNVGGQAPAIDYSQSPIIQIAKQVGPSVVGVSVSAKQMAFGQGATEKEYGYGTGFIVSADGYIVTNNHVTEGSDSIKVTLFDGTEYPASLVGADKPADLAVIKIDAAGLTPVAIGNSKALQVGETVVAIGNPLGSELAGSVTSGIVSALNREITTSNQYSQKYIQTDAAINPGNSGGPLVNLKGEVIGINTLKTYLAGYDDYGMPIGTEGIGFSIPMDTAQPIIEQLITKGSVQRPGIGVTCLVDETNTYNPSGSPEGVTVVKVIQGSPADVAGIDPSDIITTLDGTAVKTVDELKSILQAHNVGDVLDITVWRAGQEYKAKITVGDQNNMG